MKIWRGPFNIYLIALVILPSLGCQSTGDQKQKRELSTLRLHLEIDQVGANRNMPVMIPRENPVTFNVDRFEFINEANVAHADLVDGGDGFSIQVQFDRKGSWLLENYTAANIGRHILIFSQFSEPRWLAAPIIHRRVSDGVLGFTPDATRQEAERIVRGLNNLAAKIKKRDKF